jgi:hypothetical protein
MKLRTVTLACLIAVLILTSCSPVATIVTAMPTESVEITQTVVATESTKLSSPTNVGCIKFSQGEPTGTGYLISRNLKREMGDTDKVIDMKTGDYKEYLKQLDIKVSPNGNALAYTDIQSDGWDLVVENGENIIRIPVQNIRSFAWVNPQTIAIKEDDDPQTYTLFLNPFSNELNRIETNFPDIYTGGLMNPFRNDPVFDPSLTYVAYHSISGSEFAGISVVRIKDNVVIGNYGIFPFIYPPVWSPLGESLIIPSTLDDNRELIRVFVDQNAIALTNFEVSYPNFALYSYLWSPDGRKIAFWFLADSSRDQEPKSLAFIDLDNGDVTVTCIQSASNILALTDDPVWSPKSDQLVVRIEPAADNGDGALVLVDVIKMIYRVIPGTSNLSPMGWTIFQPDLP